jgi:hypothetical protein
MAIEKKMLMGGAGRKPKEADRGSTVKPGAELGEPVRSSTAKKLAVAKFATAKLSIAKLRTLRKIC